jgi:hypothetical protein
MRRRIKMLKINKVSLHSAIDYAAEELRKYLKMMMPDQGNIEVFYNPDANDGFRLGLMQDFGLDVSDAQEPELDDILYVNTDMSGGIIAGDNPRSVLLAVYEYLRQNGCRWLFPGVDGEFIPIKSIEAVQYRFKPACRYRGQCNEGSEYQSNMIEAIEFTPKVGMNVFMLEFFNPVGYYRQYYNHSFNCMNRPPEPISDAQVLQWKRQCEAEISKRGLMFHDIGHGWTAQSFGIDTSLRSQNDEKIAAENDKKVTDEQRQYLALVGGKRGLFSGTPNWTQFCMSNRKARKKVAEFVAEYAENHSNSDYLHVWLADFINNHCECEECVKKTPSDWYVILLNEIDEALTEKGLNTRIVYIAYTETMWAPETQRLRNPGRFALLFAPISRKYSVPLSISDEKINVVPYVRNKTVFSDDFREMFYHFKNWTKDWNGANLAYEYHFWQHQIYDVGGISLAKVINEDIKFYKSHNINGVIEDGSQRSFFPTGLSFYTYARTLFDTSLSAEEIAEEYFSCAFGEDWRDFYNYLEKLGNAFSHSYLSGEENDGGVRSKWYAPEHAASLKNIHNILREGERLIKEHYNSEYRIRTVSVRLLEFHMIYSGLLADCFIEKALGNDEKAEALMEKAMPEIGRWELAFERWYDHELYFRFLTLIFKNHTVKSENERIESN